jgi:hypothetical protein
MPPKCVETIEQPSLRDEKIVHSPKKLGGEVHHRYGYWLSHSSESSESYSCCSYPYRRGHGDRRQEINRHPVITGANVTASYQRWVNEMQKGIGDKISGALSY